MNPREKFRASIARLQYTYDQQGNRQKVVYCKKVLALLDSSVTGIRLRFINDFVQVFICETEPRKYRAYVRASCLLDIISKSQGFGDSDDILRSYYTIWSTKTFIPVLLFQEARKLLLLEK